MKKLFLLITFLQFATTYICSENWFDRDSLAQIPISSLYSRATSYLQHTHVDTAMGFYILIAKRHSPKLESSDKYICAQACIQLGDIYFKKGYYTESFDSFITATKIAEENDFEDLFPQIYNNIGKIYCSWNDHMQGVEYYKKGMKYAEKLKDEKNYKSLLINIVGVYNSLHKVDEAKLYYRKMCELVNRDSIIDYFCYLNKGLILREEKKTNDAIQSLKQTANYAIQHRLNASFLSSAYGYLAELYGDSQRDSAIYYWQKSIENPETPAYMQRESLKKLNELYKKKGDREKAIFYGNRYLVLSDSLFEEGKINRIKDAQLMYETEKTYRKINRLNAESEEKDIRIKLQSKVLIIVSGSLVLFIIMLVLLYLQKRRLNQAYQALFVRNNEILKSAETNTERRKILEKKVENLKEELATVSSQLHNHPATPPSGTRPPALNPKEASVENPKQYSVDKLTKEQKENILSAVEQVMTNTEIICDCDFNIERLADLTGYNSRYISQVINDTYCQNFRSFINEYRIREAQKRLLNIEQYGNYTIQAIAQSVGYKSHANFILLFKKHIGITPSIFQKMAKEKKGNLPDA